MGLLVEVAMDNTVGKSTMAWPFQALSQSKEATESQVRDAIERNERAAQKNAQMVERAKSSENNTREQKDVSSEAGKKPEGDGPFEKPSVNLVV